MPFRIRCDCGHEIVVDDRAVLLAEARRHALEAHQMDISADRILALAEEYAERPSDRAGQAHGGREVHATD
jgi:predicted small metal-binding protein